MLQIHGVPFSAHTRKVIVGALEKGLDYELVRVIPLAPNLSPAFVRASPLKKIPVVIHDGLAIADSTVIALYLDRVFPDRPLYPNAPQAYAKALFVEEVVDGTLAEHVLHGVLLQRVLGPLLLGLSPNQDLIETSLNDKIPARLTALEKLLDGAWFAGEFSYADVTVASILINLSYAGEPLDGRRYPKLHGFLRRALVRDAFAQALRREAPEARDIKGMDLRLLDELGY